MICYKEEKLLFYYLYGVWGMIFIETFSNFWKKSFSFNFFSFNFFMLFKLLLLHKR